MDKELEKKWLEFLEKYKDLAHGKIDSFLTELEKEYKNAKVSEFEATGANHSEAIVKARQSWVAYVGDKLESIIESIVRPIVEKYKAKIIRGKEIQNSKLNLELDAVRRNLLVHFNNFSFLPDADIIIYKYNNQKVSILAILSVKNSFRERYTETPYWKLKLEQSKITKGIQVFMVTTDRDDEISSVEKPSKARIILEYELDGVYITKNKGEFESSNKVGNLQDLLKDIETLLKK